MAVCKFSGKHRIRAFCLGFGTTVAEPALTAVAAEAAEVASRAGAIPDDDGARTDSAFELRMVVVVSVGAAIVLGVLRILKGWPIHRLIIGGYVLVTVMTVFAPDEIIGVAYDSGGVTTSTITVPLVTALGVGLATSINGRNPMIDGFGLIAFRHIARRGRGSRPQSRRDSDCGIWCSVTYRSEGRIARAADTQSSFSVGDRLVLRLRQRWEDFVG